MNQMTPTKHHNAIVLVKASPEFPPLPDSASAPNLFCSGKALLLTSSDIGMSKALPPTRNTRGVGTGLMVGVFVAVGTRLMEGFADGYSKCEEEM